MAQTCHGSAGAGGGGKTTLCLCLAGLMPRVFGGTLNGSMRVAGFDPRRSRPSEYAHTIGVVFEDYFGPANPDPDPG